jgi:hypothetical protein
MNPIIDYAKKTKAKALRLRDQLNFDEAVSLLRKAELSLNQELEVEIRDRGEARPEQHELDLALQLTHIRGSLGGVFRRQGVRADKADQRNPFFQQSVKAYDAGYDVEQAYRRDTDSYTLVQRLVARVMLEPAAVAAQTVVVRLPVRSELQTAAATIRAQTQPGRSREKDEYAFGDLSLVSLLLGENDWREEMRTFHRMPNADYAINGTREVITDIRTVAATSPDSGKLVAELDEALDILA